MFSETALISGVKKRNRKALQELHDRFAPVLLGLSLRYCGNLADAEDVLHDAFIRILSNIDTFVQRPESSFEGWLKRITVNTALNFIRAKAKSSFFVGINTLTEELPEEESVEGQVSKIAEFLSKDAIMQMVCELPDGYRMVFNLYVFEEYTHKEIANVLDCSENTSKSQLYKARAMLRKKILEKAKKELIETER
jgi:RNA polymerase sigma-70 factor (ECF subfamily)